MWSVERLVLRWWKASAIQDEEFEVIWQRFLVLSWFLLTILHYFLLIHEMIVVVYWSSAPLLFTLV